MDVSVLLVLLSILSKLQTFLGNACAIFMHLKGYAACHEVEQELFKYSDSCIMVVFRIEANITYKMVGFFTMLCCVYLNEIHL